MFEEASSGGEETLVEGYDWQDVRRVVDVGGSDGAVVNALARAYRNLDYLVQSLPQTIENATVPQELSDRVELVTHDMFQEQTISDADVYLIRFVLHDWSDKYAVKFLYALILGLGTRDERNKRILIKDTCLPDCGTMSLFDQRFLRATSLTMREIQNVKERNAQEWRDLMRFADPRLV
ncbi:O-methyltransferase [Massariosphaeria phaeospora]|uniref:O-methyltransferase n=1 Tax=Massariosphaeria phaeospora TaxID=100035 RepID=A0A7C8III1_9PLEO|nr:O-methyltransferase [Massariosphaeria phaeospora]